MPESIGAPRASRNDTPRGYARCERLARDAGDQRCDVRRPDTRTMPMPPRPGGVAIAAIGGAAGGASRARLIDRDDYSARTVRAAAATWLPPLRVAAAASLLEHPVHLPLLRDLQHVVDEPVQHEARRERTGTCIENATGMICITFACTGSVIGVGDSFTCRYAVIA